MSPYLRRLFAVLSTPQQGFDPLRTLTQILCVQSLHYLALSLLIPTLLRLVPSSIQSRQALDFEGGSMQVGLVMDWREVSARPTWDWDPVDRPSVSWSKTRLQIDALRKNASAEETAQMQRWDMGSVWLNQAVAGDRTNVTHPLVLKSEQVHWQEKQQQRRAAIPKETMEREKAALHKQESSLERWEWDISRDTRRSWVIALAWLLSAGVDVQSLLHLVRRPTHILDHVMTLHLLHILFTSLYARSVPTSFFWWTLMILHAILVSFVCKKLCVRRELANGFDASAGGAEEGLSFATRRQQTEQQQQQSADIALHGGSLAGSNPARSKPHVLFDGEEDEEEDEEHDHLLHADENGNGNKHSKEDYEMTPRVSKGIHGD